MECLLTDGKLGIVGGLAPIIRRPSTVVWNGAGSNNNMTNGDNWVGGNAPITGDTIEFAGSTRPTPFNDYPINQSFGGINFGATATTFTVTGNRVVLTGNISIVAGSPSQNLGLDIVLDVATCSTIVPNGVTLTLSGVISEQGGSRNLSKSALVGGLTISGTANTFSGTFTANAGTITVTTIANVGGGPSSLGAPTTVGNGTINLSVNNTVTLNISSTGIVTSDRNINLAGNGFSAIITRGPTAQLTLSGAITCSVGATTRTLTITPTGTADIIISGVISNGTATLALTKNGTGKLTLTNLNTYSGQTYIQNGTISIDTIKDVGGGASALGAPTTGGNGTILMGSDSITGTLIYTGGPQTTNRAITLTGVVGVGAINHDGTGVLDFTTGGVSGTGAGYKTLLLAGSNTGNGKIGGIIINSSSVTNITKQGTNNWELSGVNTYTGTTTVNAGSLSLSGARVAATCGSMIVDGGGTLVITNGTYNMTTSVVTVGILSAGTINHKAGTIVFTSGNQIFVGGAGNGVYNFSGGTITCAGATANRGIVIGTSTGTTTNSFNMNENDGTATLTIPAGGALLIGRFDSAANNNTNSFNMTAGTVSIPTFALGGIAGTSTGGTYTLDVSGGTFTSTNFAVFAAGNTNTAIINVSGTGVLEVGAFPITRGTSATATLNVDGGKLRPPAALSSWISAIGVTSFFIKAGGCTLDIPSGKDSVISAPMLTHGVSTGGGITKIGVGEVILFGAATYTGTTLVSAGSMYVNASFASTAAYTVDGGLLGGNGTVAGPVTIANTTGSTLRAGYSTTGTFTINNTLTFNGLNSILQCNTNTATFTTITCNNLVDLGGCTVNLQDTIPVNSYDIVTTSSTISGLTVQGTSADKTWSSLTITGGNTKLTAVLV